MKYLVILLALISCTKPDFKVGQCIKPFPDTKIAEWEKRSIDKIVFKILRVGEENYLASELTGFFSPSEKIYYKNFFKYAEVVPCPK